MNRHQRLELTNVRNTTQGEKEMSVELLEGIIAADQALITALKNQREQLRTIVEELLNCVDTDRDWNEVKRAHAVLRSTQY